MGTVISQYLYQLEKSFRTVKLIINSFAKSLQKKRIKNKKRVRQLKEKKKVYDLTVNEIVDIIYKLTHNCTHLA